MRTADPVVERAVAVANVAASYVPGGMRVKDRHREAGPTRVGMLAVCLAIAASACGASSGAPAGTTASAPTAAAPSGAPTTGSPTTRPSAAPSPSGQVPTVLLERTRTRGTILVDTAGQPLYENRADTAGGVGSINCTGACLRSWKPLLLSPSDLAPVAPHALAGLLAVVQRPDGAQQVSYGGAPLYIWVGTGPAPSAAGWEPVVIHPGAAKAASGAQPATAGAQ